LADLGKMGGDECNGGGESGIIAPLHVAKSFGSDSVIAPGGRFGEWRNRADRADGKPVSDIARSGCSPSCWSGCQEDRCKSHEM
jgi:hypothetical protein